MFQVITLSYRFSGQYRESPIATILNYHYGRRHQLYYYFNNFLTIYWAGHKTADNLLIVQIRVLLADLRQLVTIRMYK